MLTARQGVTNVMSRDGNGTVNERITLFKQIIYNNT